MKMELSNGMLNELTQQELHFVSGGTHLGEWFSIVSSSAALGGVAGGFAAGPAGAVVGGVTGAVVGSYIYAGTKLYDYYNSK
jgi:hypothetical protein